MSTVLSYALIAITVVVGILVITGLTWLLYKWHRWIGGWGIFTPFKWVLILLGSPFGLVWSGLTLFGADFKKDPWRYSVPFVYVVTMHVIMFLAPTPSTFFVKAWNHSWQMFASVEIAFCLGLYFLYPKSGWARPIIASFLMLLIAVDTLPYLNKELQITATLEEQWKQVPEMGWRPENTAQAAVMTKEEVFDQKYPFSDECGKLNGPTPCRGVISTFEFVKEQSDADPGESDDLPGAEMESTEESEPKGEDLPDSIPASEEMTVYIPWGRQLCWNVGDSVTVWAGNSPDQLRRLDLTKSYREHFTHMAFGSQKAENAQFIIARSCQGAWND